MIIICLFLINNFNVYNDIEQESRENFLVIPKIYLNEKIDLDITLDTGVEIHEISHNTKYPLVLMGHSGIGVNAVFNDLENLFVDDEIFIVTKDSIYKYSILEIYDHIKGNTLEIEPDNTYLYLVTCDKNNLQKQLIFKAKFRKSAKI